MERLARPLRGAVWLPQPRPALLIFKRDSPPPNRKRWAPIFVHSGCTLPPSTLGLGLDGALDPSCVNLTAVCHRLGASVAMLDLWTVSWGLRPSGLGDRYLRVHHPLHGIGTTSFGAGDTPRKLHTDPPDLPRGPGT
jgi:hypothetical protein